MGAPGVMQPQRVTPPQTETRGIYVLSVTFSSGNEIFGYKARNRSNDPPICTVNAGSTAAAIAVDLSGNLIVGVNGASTSEVLIFKGPAMCGSELGSFSDPYGQPDDAASNDAVNGKIAVANVFDGDKQSHSAGSISVCTFARGCNVNLTNAAMYEVYGVAMDRHGNCWASATNPSGAPTLTYFARCAGAGRAVTGWVNPYPGGLDIDKAGNLAVSVSWDSSELYVYKGCKPGCILVGGPFGLHGQTTHAHLNKRSTKLVGADFQNFQIDVYNYSPTSLKYEYSFNNGLDDNYVCCVAVSPHSKE